MKNKIIKAIYHLWEYEFHMKRVQVQSNVPCVKEIDCYKYKDFFVKLSSFLDPKLGRVYCIEAADESEVKNNIFDDAWIYYESDGLEEIISEMKKDLIAA